VNTKHLVRVLAVACLILASTGCERASVEGMIIDERGERLPGVVVSVEGTRDQALSNAMGEYTVQFRPRGPHVLDFHKSGFAPAMLELDVDGPRTVQARTVEMWRVPPNAGVFILDDFRFEGTTPVEVAPFPFENQVTAYGTQRDPEYFTENVEPIIIIYRLPTFDVRLARLEERPVAMPDGTAIENGPKAWVLAESLAVDLAPMDQPEGLLGRLVYDGPLDPGVYAVHWDALNGHTSIEARIFMFRILTPEEAAAPEVLTEDPDEDSTPAIEIELSDEPPAVDEGTTEDQPEL
jgi:hypothetical protein